MAKDIVSYFLEQGEPIIPKRKPRYSYQLKKLDTQAAKNTLSSGTIDYLKRELQDKAYQNKEITSSDYYEMIKPESEGPRLEDGRIRFRGGDAARSDAASGRDAGRSSPSGGADDRSSEAQTAAHNRAVAAAQQVNVPDNKMNIINTLGRFRPNTYVNPYNYSIGLNKNIGPLSLNADINTFGILGIDDPRTPEDETEKDDYGIEAGYNTNVLGGNLSLGGSYNPTTGANLGLSFSKQFNKGGRVGFNKGTDKDFNRNPGGKNQYTANMRTDAEIQKIIDSKPKNWTKKDFRGEGKLNDKKILTRNETDRPGLKFYHSGKRVFKDSRGDQNLKASQFYKATQGSAITMDKINNFAHFAPKILSYLTSTADTGPLKAKVNRAAEGYDKKALEIAKKQEKLITEKPKGYRLKLDAANKEAREASVKANKKLPKNLKGTLGYFVVNPSTGEFKLKGVDKAKTFAGISGEKREFKSMNPSERANYGKTQSVVQSLIDKVKSKFPNVKTTRATNLPLPPKTVTANMFKGAFKGLPGKAGEVKDPLGGPDLIDIKKLDKNPYNDA